ncbi:MAG: site-specific integrase [Candidatus Eremiobacteraeota bacterium]|nr:site-specific integrase [Candidatus Eremiobacteraeota bacterium]
MRWDAVDFEKRTVRVLASLETVREGGATVVRSKVPKTPKSRREVPLSRMAIEVLRRQRVAQAERRLALGGSWGDEGLVFPNPATGEAWRPDAFSAGFGRLIARSGLPKVSFHGLRHGFASIQLKAGTPLTVVSGLLGHSSVGITGDVYSHILDGMKAQVADRLDAIFDKATARAKSGL